MSTGSAKSLRRPLIAGNWKMNLGLKDSVDLVRQLVDGAPAGGSGPEIMVAPPFTALTVVAELLKGKSIKLGAQNMHPEASGAFTGEVSPSQLLDVGCSHVILGHSERRRMFGDTDAFIKKKLQAAVKLKLVPVLCIGETLEERESNRTFRVLETQIKGALEGFAPTDLAQLVVAYEPVWAIGTGKTATPDQAQQAHAFVRQQLKGLYGEGWAQSVRILYGGSVTPENVDELMSQPDVDGALVGGASLKPVGFLRIINFKAGTKASA
ncbi:MAG: triose-phosphate isomerase [Elusimicrobia bacterium]|nr:triose-phosphate isomerase [Elusimicrobiota bacterium]